MKIGIGIMKQLQIKLEIKIRSSFLRGMPCSHKFKKNDLFLRYKSEKYTNA